MTKQAKIALALLAALAVGCCAALLLPKPEAAVARITQNGKLVREIDLSARSAPESIQLRDETGTVHNVIQVEAGRIRMLEADCPDQVCVNQGWISDSALPIVCLPNQVIIEIVGGEGNLDVIVK